MLVNVFNYGFNIFLSHRLSVAEYGSLWTLTTVVLIGSTPAVVLLNIAARFSALFYAQGDNGKMVELKSSVCKIAAIFGTAALTCSIAVCVPAAGYLRIDDPWVVFTSGVTLGALFMLYGFRGIMQGAHQFAAYARSTILESGLRLLFAVAALSAHLGLRGAIAAYAGGSIAATAAAGSALVTTGTNRLKLDLRDLLKTTSGIALSILALTMLGFSDTLLVKHFLDPMQAGLFGIVALSGKIVSFLVGFLPTLVLPRSAARIAQGRSPVKVLALAMVTALGLSAIALATFGFFPTTITRVLGGASYIAAAPYLFWYAAAMVLLGATNIFASYLTALHRFVYAVPLFVLSGLEIAAIYVRHGSITEIVQVVLIVNLAALIVTGAAASATFRGASAPRTEFGVA